MRFVSLNCLEFKSKLRQLGIWTIHKLYNGCYFKNLNTFLKINYTLLSGHVLWIQHVLLCLKQHMIKTLIYTIQVYLFALQLHRFLEAYIHHLHFHLYIFYHSLLARRNLFDITWYQSNLAWRLLRQKLFSSFLCLILQVN